MTIFELFPYGLALIVTMASTSLLRKFGISIEFAFYIGLALGVTSWSLVVFGGRYLVSLAEKRKSKKSLN